MGVSAAVGGVESWVRRLHEVANVSREESVTNMDQHEKPRTRTATGNQLARLWGLDVEHALYRKTGNWYHYLTRFPGALLDPAGYVIFRTEADFTTCPGLQLGRK